MRRSVISLFIVAITAFGCGSEEEESNQFFGKELTQVTTEGGGQPSWSPDGTRIAYTLAGDVWMMTLE